MYAEIKEKVMHSASDGIITSKKITELGLHRSILSKMVKDDELIQCSRGIYMLPDEWEDEFLILQKKYSRGIFSHGTALYLLGYAERVPLRFHMTFPSNYHAPSIEKENVIVTRVIHKNYELGQSSVFTPCGNSVATYDLERSLCDIVRGSGDDIQIIQFAMKKYAQSNERNIHKLMTYARQLRVESKIRRYMEVLL